MNINQRIRNLRKSLNLNQKDFGVTLGMGQAAISWMEQDGNTIVDQNKRLICDKFHVSIHWLETGEGNMYVQNGPDIIAQLSKELGLDEQEQQILAAYQSFPAERRQQIVRFITDLSAKLASQHTAAPADDIDAKVAAYRQELLAQKQAASSSAFGKTGTTDK